MPAVLPNAREIGVLYQLLLRVIVVSPSCHSKQSHMIVGLVGAMASLFQAPTANLTCGKNKTLERALSLERTFYFLEFSEVLLYHT